ALSSKFTRGKIAPAYGASTIYAKDAMTGLRLLNEVMDPVTRAEVLATHTYTEAAATAPADWPAPVMGERRRSSKARVDVPKPRLPYPDRKVRTIPHLAEVWSYVNPYMLYGRHLGFQGNFEKALAERDPKALELFHQVEEVKQRAARFMKLRAVWQFFEAESDTDAIHLFAPGGETPLHTFRFSRQHNDDGLSLADYILPADGDGRDSLCLFVTTAGDGVRAESERAKEAGEYFLSHALQALAIETAEASAEWLHRRLREDWGFPDPPSVTMKERFTSRYRGKRYSFGYPACPNLADQEGIWKLLEPEQIGVELTDGMMMEPEASVSALVFHHPDCTYFTVAEPAEVPVTS
ncbi:MAG: methionine synthase, partial [bacterium]|nr:methionine synthase [bacterium]